jgi:hypothetical protein
VIIDRVNGLDLEKLLGVSQNEFDQVIHIPVAIQMIAH